VGCQPAASRIASAPAASAEHPGLGLGGCSPPGRWHPRPEQHRPGRRRAHRCRARPLHGDRGGRGVNHPRAAQDQHRADGSRRGGGRQGAAVGASWRQARRSQPTEQRFPPVERPTVNTAARARRATTKERRTTGGEEDIMLVEHAHQPGRFDPRPLPGLRPRDRPAGPRLEGATRGAGPQGGPARHGRSSPVTSTSAATQHLRDLARLRRVRDRLDRDYARPLDLQALARGAHLAAGHLQQSLHRAGRDAAQRLSGPGGGRDGGSAVVGGETGDQTGQESRSTGHRAAPRLAAMRGPSPKGGKV
jgi:hypothetical protein